MNVRLTFHYPCASVYTLNWICTEMDERKKEMKEGRMNGWTEGRKSQAERIMS